METKLNTTQTKFEKPEEYWHELGQFRDQHKDDCVSSNRAYFDGTTNSLFDTTLITDHNARDNYDAVDDGINHKC